MALPRKGYAGLQSSLIGLDVLPSASPVAVHSSLCCLRLCVSSACLCVYVSLFPPFYFSLSVSFTPEFFHGLLSSSPLHPPSFQTRVPSLKLVLLPSYIALVFGDQSLAIPMPEAQAPSLLGGDRKVWAESEPCLLRAPVPTHSSSLTLPAEDIYPIPRAPH